MRANLFEPENTETLSADTIHGLHGDLSDLSLAEMPSDPASIAELFLKYKATESRLNNIIQNFPGIFFTQRPDLSYSFISPAFENLLGIKVNYRSVTWFLNLIHDEDLDYYIKETEKNTPLAKSFNLSYRLKNPITKAIVYVMDVRTPIFSPAGLLLEYDGVWVDNTRQAIAESHLTSTSWKTTLATITNGLVHDFSNVMAGVLSISELYFDAVKEGDPMHKGLSQIKKSAFDAQKIVRKIIELNRKQTNVKSYYNIEQLIEDQIDLIKIILPKHIVVTTQLVGREVPVYTEDVAFRQTLLNFAMNSRYAMGNDHGELGIRLRLLKAGEPMMSGAYDAPRLASVPGVEIAFSDTGSGIPSEYLSKIFQPFFSTKEATKGSGFGLYNAKLYVESSGGEIGVASVVGKGTTFYLFLPTVQEDDEPIDDAPQPVKQRLHIVVYGKQKPDSLDIVDALRAEGHELICFESIKELTRYQKNTQLPVDIVIAVDVANDENITDLLHFFKKCYSSVARYLVTIGENPDSVSLDTKALVQFHFTESTPLQEIVDTLSPQS